RADPDRLQQVIGNLLSNAVKFTGSGGRITVGLREDGAVTELTVEDTGQGIGPELLPHIFDRFRQGDNSSTRQVSGLGLGLTLVREIVALQAVRFPRTAQDGAPAQLSSFACPRRDRWRGRPHRRTVPCLSRSSCSKPSQACRSWSWTMSWKLARWSRRCCGSKAPRWPSAIPRPPRCGSCRPKGLTSTSSSPISACRWRTAT